MAYIYTGISVCILVPCYHQQIAAFVDITTLDRHTDKFAEIIVIDIKKLMLLRIERLLIADIVCGVRIDCRFIDFLKPQFDSRIDSLVGVCTCVESYIVDFRTGNDTVFCKISLGIDHLTL